MDLNEFSKRKIPADIERLSEKEKVARLHHQLGVIYDRVMLSGDWSADHDQPKVSENIRTNIFEDHTVNDLRVLADGIGDFISASKHTLAKSIDPDTLRSPVSVRELNRKAFKELVRHVQNILLQAAKSANTKELAALCKSVDRHMSYFRDKPNRLEHGNMPDAVNDDDHATAALQYIVAELEIIDGTIEDVGEKNG